MSAKPSGNHKALKSLAEFGCLRAITEIRCQSRRSACKIQKKTQVRGVQQEWHFVAI
jgi:hypothetical protein